MRGFWTGLLGTNESHLSVELTMYSFNPKYKFLPHRDLDRTDIPQYLISRNLALFYGFVFIYTFHSDERLLRTKTTRR